MSIEVSSEKDNVSSMHNLKKLSDRSDIRVHLGKKESLTKQERGIRPGIINAGKFADWPDIVFRYYEDTDSLAVYFVKATPGVIYYCENASDDILVSYTRDDRIVSVDIDGASKILQCHVFDVREVIDGKAPLTLNPIYYEDSDVLKVYFVDYISSTNTLRNNTNTVKTDIEDIEVELDDMGQIICILFLNADKKLAKPISEKEREHLARVSEEEAKELEERSHRIVLENLLKKYRSEAGMD